MACMRSRHQLSCRSCLRRAKEAATLYKASETHFTMAKVGGNSVDTGNIASHSRSLDSFIAEARHSVKFRSQLACGSLLRSQGVSTQPSAICDSVRKRMRFDPFRTSLLSCWQNACTSMRHQGQNLVSDTKENALGTLRRQRFKLALQTAAPPC